ncbi:hypothetical protein Afil01_20270 [Actinorhabdospora filicis]|uniref:Gram-positive cocci surface proteins LPxTG domain-containing protein n=1 Tax=Actinorhabdospora filicis TaxID=1785913 RepID=A0A9W6SJR7_9ACTN|nr:hypothetical protein [Actinorhabdospora filicis]GLZ77220.1 hypothetical protein Afil01_20270 [Actinorhabdospora filicis]
MRRLILPALTAVTVLLAAPGAAHADHAQIQVTFAARECPEYSDIMANKARNNIQESLEDLGKDSTYGNGQPVDADLEARENPACKPLTGWTLTLGNGIGGKKDGLTVISGSPVATVKTAASTPQLDPQGRATGKTLRGATTLTLTEQQFKDAQNYRLTAQGGTKSDPLNTADFGNKYSFGTLRCAIDNRNADNIEYINFPSGVRHVFCFYYAVAKPPEPGTIVVRKELPSGYTDSGTAFYTGNVSYEAGGKFQIDLTDGQPNQVSFRRNATGAGDDPWTFTEHNTPGWDMRSLTCASRNGDSVPTVTGKTASIVLAAGDTVTCTYVNERVTTRQITLFKRTLDGFGGPFKISVKGPTGQVVDLGEVSTTQEGVGVEAGGRDNLPAGEYTVTEIFPQPTAAGHWEGVGLQCNGVAKQQGPAPVTTQPTASYSVYLNSNSELNCVLTNRWTPDGSITPVKITKGGTTTAEFAVLPLDDPPGGAQAPLPPMHTKVTTDKENTAKAAPPIGGLATGRYTLTELAMDDGHWKLTDVSCPGGEIGPDGSVTVELTEDAPDVRCTFTNERPREPSPSVKPTLPPTGGSEAPRPLTVIGLAAIAAGTIAYLAARKRRAKREDA